MATPDLVQWCCRELSKLLQFEASEDIASYMLSMESSRDLEDYLLELLDGSDPKNRRFLDELLKRWKPAVKQPEVPENVIVYKKSSGADEQFGVQEKKKKKTKGKQKSTQGTGVSGGPGTAGDEEEEENHPPGLHFQTPSGGKTKWKSLYGEDGEDHLTAVMLPGRHPCECLGQKHRLVNNCLTCGRIVCEQEGSGPCLFCGALVCTKEEMEVLARNSNKSERLRRKLLGGLDEQGGRKLLPHEEARLLEGKDKAEAHKNKLLEYDRTSAKRTQVLDDEADYFSVENQWLSKDEREALKKREDELREQRFGSRLTRKVTLDFAGRRVVEDDSVVDVYNREDEVVQRTNFGVNRKGKGGGTEEGHSGIVNPNIKIQPPKFVPSEESEGKRPPAPLGSQSEDREKHRTNMRIQDRELQEMRDDGMCLSMHQPWASLLVLGIKKHEGRTWYSPHRGRLWIAAASKQPSQEEVAEVENAHRIIANEPHLQFPKDYPVACLLGCVDVADVLPQEEYREQYPDGESASDFVFICENFQELIIKFPIKGKHKIWRLDPTTHKAAKKGLRPVNRKVF
ncbi:TRIP4 [Branchiostoma lanceolatum]|uniref:TRIP4 protein n=1 Tax=Branchiostoma lanceolatum TaxID=7740 RepID=A0A8K0END1_BRALA|nr:TRIP4 [Branchiostoma lanceolatum]